jgi:hypothetical protein
MGKMMDRFKAAVESWLQAPVPDVQEIPASRFDIKRSYTDEPLTDDDRMDLAEVRGMPGYSVILAILERSAEGFTTNLVISTDPSDESAVLAAHKVAHTAWLLYMSFQKQVEAEIDIVSSQREAVAMENALIEKAGQKVGLDDPDAARRVQDPTYVPDIRSAKAVYDAIREAKKYNSQNPLDQILNIKE